MGKWKNRGVKILSLIRVLSGTVQQEWIDYNGHMGDFAYGIVFSNALTAFEEMIGITDNYRRQTSCMIYTMEIRISYLRECRLGQSFHVLLQVLDADHKRIHTYLRMVEDESGQDLSWCEQLFTHTERDSKGTARSVPFPSDLLETIEHYRTLHEKLESPYWIRNRIGIRRRQ